MASPDVAAVVRKPDWTSLPWALIGVGLAMSLLALVLTRLTQTEPELGRILLLSVGLLCTGTAVAIRLNTTGPAALERVAGPSRAPLLMILAALFALMVLAATTVVILTFFEPPWLPWGTGTALILWFVTAPLCSLTAYRVFHLNRQRGSFTAQEETATLLFLTAVCGFVASWALYLPDSPTSWDTIRLALLVFSSVALIATPLPLATLRVRRWTISVLVVLHFSAIGSATLSAPPSPWLVGQLWIRIYRPYLEFMYLNNAYHFYSPEPGPASYVWFRLIYVDSRGTEWGEWYKVPGMDENGRHEHEVALVYQRYLALTENVTGSEPPPPYFTLTPDGNQVVADFIKRRQENAPRPPVVGVPTPALAVPFHPFVPTTQQFSLPNGSTQRMLRSFARHVAKVKEQPPASLPGSELRWIKIYRVRHEIPPADAYAKVDPPMAPNDPELYRPYYMGKYDTQGELIDGPDKYGKGADPFLYWLLPILRDDTSNQRSPIRDFARLHAGDARWIYIPDEGKWVER